MKRIPRLFSAIIASALFRYPAWLFLLNSATIQKIQASAENYKLICSWDCPLYAKQVEFLAPGAFFPLFSIIGKVFLPFTSGSSHLAAIVVSNVFTVIAGVLTLYLAEALWRESERFILGFRSTSWMLLAVLSFFPYSHFWIRGYPESLFYSLFLAGILAMVSRRWIFASFWIGLSAVTRPQGLWLVAAFGLLLMLSQVRLRERWDLQIGRKTAVYSFLVALFPFAVFLLWNWKSTGSAFYFLEAQKGWGRSFDLILGVKSTLIPKFEDTSLYLYLSLIASFVYILRKTERPWLYIGLTTLMMAQLPLDYGGFYSYTRFMTTNLGLFCIIVEIGTRVRPLFWIWLVWSLSRLAASAHSAGFGLWTG
jgi:hypothetical protein